MNIRLMIFNLVFVIGFDVAVTVALAEDDNNEPASDVEVNNNESKNEIANDTKLIQLKEKKKSVPKQNKRSIKMIVGGQSKDGLAKQVILPVND